MKKKLTLVVDEEVIERAKRLAKYRDASVSEMVEQYLIRETEDETWTPPKGSVLSALTGSVPHNASGLSDDERLEMTIREKHT